MRTSKAFSSTARRQLAFAGLNRVDFRVKAARNDTQQSRFTLDVLLNLVIGSLLMSLPDSLVIGIYEASSKRKQLMSEIDCAVRGENYLLASKLKKELEDVNNKDPFYCLNLELEKMILEQRYQVGSHLSMHAHVSMSLQPNDFVAWPLADGSHSPMFSLHS
jgi:hypothetical protein